MAITEIYSGTQAVVNDEWSLTADTTTKAAITTDGVFQVFADVSDMVAGDVLVLSIYEKCRSGGAQRNVYEQTLTGVQSAPLWVSPALILLHGWEVTAYAASGTITVLWSIRQVA